jgi:hypothetical protein
MLARTLLYEAAVVILTRVKRASGLKDCAQAIARRASCWSASSADVRVAHEGEGAGELRERPSGRMFSV